MEKKPNPLWIVISSFFSKNNDAVSYSQVYDFDDLDERTAEKEGLSKGALIGIIVASSIVGAGLIAAAIAFIVIHYRRKNKVKMKVNSQMIDLIQFS